MMVGRPRSFDRDTALLQATERFWRDGFDATTVAKLTAEMGVGAPSLYAAFGDKDQLFNSAARCYYEGVSVQTERALDCGTAREGIEELLRMSAEAYADPATPPGCFMLSEPRLAAYRALLRQQIARRVERGVAEGDVRRGESPDRIAEFLMAVLTGMSARAKDGGSAADLTAIVEVSLRVLPM